MTTPQQSQQSPHGSRPRQAAVRRRVQTVMRDHSYDRLRTRQARYLLAGTLLSGLAAAPVAFLLGGSWAGLPVVLACTVLWLTLRISLRLVADLPEEYLDERQSRIRNRAHVEAYQWLSAAAVLTAGAGLLAFIIQGKDPETDTVALSWDQANALFSFIAALALTLPSIVVALRDEEHP